MKAVNTEELKNQINQLTEYLGRLKTGATAIISEIDDGKFLSDEKINTFSNDLTLYQEYYKKFCDESSALSISACDAIENAKQAINTYEESMKRDNLRAIVQDYLHLNSENETDRSKLDESKEKLTQICKKDEDIREALSAYEIVVNAVRDSITDLDDEVFQFIQNQIQTRIAIALISSRLYIDKDLDISKYVDNSCDLLSTDKQPDSDHGNPDTDDKDSPGTNIISNPEQPEPEKPPHDRFSGFLENVTFDYIDTPASELSTNKFKNDVKGKPSILGCLSAIAFLKFFDPSSETDKKRFPSFNDVISFLLSEKYVTKATVSAFGYSKDYYVLTSKGYACFERTDTRKLFNDNIIPPEIMRVPPRQITSTHAAQSLLIKSYLEQHQELGLISIYQYTGKTQFAFASVRNLENSETYCVIAAVFDKEAFDMEDFQDAITALEGFSFIFLVKEDEDIKILRNEYKLHSSDGKDITYNTFKIYTEPVTDDTEPEPLENEKIPEVSDGSESGENLTWESLGISDPAALIYKDKGIKIEITESKKAAKPFSVKEFKSDLKQLPETKRAVDVLHAIHFSKFITPRNVSILSGSMDYNYTGYIDKLYQLGYLRKIASENEDPFYCITAKGNRIFASKDSASFLDMKPDSQNFKVDQEPATEKNYLSRKLYLKTVELTKQIDEESKFDSIDVKASEVAFLVSYSREGNKRISFYSIVTDTPADFDYDDRYHFELLESSDIFVVIGYNAVQAEALVKLWYSRYAEKLTGIDLKYYDYEEDKLYDFAPDIISGQGNAPEKDDSDVPAESEETAEADEVTTAPHEEDINGLSERPLPVNVPEEAHPADGIIQSAKTLNAEARAHIDHLVDSMIANDKFYCATAYLAAVSNNYPEYRPLYSQLAYAVNDPLYECSYTSQKLFDTYFHDDTAASDFYVISAVLRNFFLDHNRYDYNMQSLYDAVRESVSYSICPQLKGIVRSIMEFKRDNKHGLDFYADYRVADGTSYEENLREICNDAIQLYSSQVEGITKENAKNKRALETKKLVFARDGDIATMLSFVAKNELDNLELIRTTVEDLFIKEGSEFAYENLDPLKIDQFVDKAWDEAQDALTFKKNNVKLVSGVRRNLISKIKEALSVLCRYVEIGQSGVNKQADEGYIAYKKLRSSLLSDIDICISEYEKSLKDNDATLSGKKTVLYTLNEIKDKVTGSYRDEGKKNFYLPFLQNKYILLDDCYMPILEDIDELPEMSASTRIELHFNAEPMSYTDRLTDILNGQDDYGSAKLIAKYLASHPTEEIDSELIEDKLREGVIFPRENIKNIKKEFEEYLELAQYFGQIDNSVDNKKETFLQIVDHWYEVTLENDNYGFFNDIIQAFKEKIKQDAVIRAKDLLTNLNAYKKANAEWEKSDLIKDTLSRIEYRIDCQNYSAAEDLLNRLQANDIEPGISYLENDYLSAFIEEYKDLTRDAGTSRTPFQLSLTSNTKENKGGRMLLENWPKGTGTKVERIKDLLAGLGFNIESITEKTRILNNFDNFFVKLEKPANGRKSNYKHPISIFGSEAEETEFRVVGVYGKRGPQELIDIFKEIGSAKNTVVFLDCTMNLPERRELARRAKKEFGGKTFIVIDRVVITYLAKHYSQTATNRMLMAITVPFAYYQPYISDSSKVMPPEIFMGRKTELEKIESSSGVNIVYGGRQLGKSALLRMAQKDINWDENGDRAVLVDIKGLNYKAAAAKVAGELYDQFVLDRELTPDEACDWSVIGREIKNILRNGNSRGRIPYLLLLLDEADVFIESCEEVNFAPFDALKDIQGVGSGRFKFVVAGLRNVVRLKKNVALGHNSVLTHLSYLTVTPFKTAEARELLEVPLSYLGFRFPDDSKTNMLISNIFGTTNYFPGLLQMYCAKLIEAMKKDYAGYDQSDTPPYYIREEHIKKVLADKSLEQQIREKFMITLKVDEDDYYYQLALLAAFHYHNNAQSGCSPKEILEIAQDYCISKIANLNVDEIEALMEELRELNVFQQVGNGNYRFVRHSFCGMMGSKQEIEDKMLEYAD